MYAICTFGQISRPGPQGNDQSGINTGPAATCHFDNVPFGDYAIVVFHDENRDGEFNQNWMGMPKEGYGFSDNPSALKKPVFEDAKFVVEQPVVELTIKLNYWL